MLLVVLLCVLKYIVDTMLAMVAPSSPAGWVGMHCCWYHSCYEYSIIFCPAVDVEMMKWWCRACYINATGWLFCCVICNILLIPCLLWMLVLAVLQQVLRWINDVTLVMKSPCSVCVLEQTSCGIFQWYSWLRLEGLWPCQDGANLLKKYETNWWSVHKWMHWDNIKQWWIGKALK